ncbi:TetR/AcrR family transcriptional regulator [Pasteurellaceae bacterium LIM206]|nr:TetR/AcrR family transcriptional regulator [Pasteurellaceae bacterium LIM206]
MTEEKTDLRVIKTHKVIRQALVDLLNEKGFDEISVQDILNKALVNRTTFYRYYSGKVDLAGKMAADLQQLFASKIRQRLESGNLELFYLQTLSQMFEVRHTILALWKIETPRLHLYRDMHQLSQQFIMNLLNRANADPDYIHLQSTLFATMMLENVRYHFERDQQPNPRITLAKMQEVLDLVKY